MSESPTSSPATNPETGTAFSDLSREEMQSALFAQMVMQQSSLAMMLLGKTPHPESGQTIRDLDAAKLFIDQLEMLEVKTKGNLNAQESALLKQSLMALRLAFVEEVNKPEAQTKTAETTPAEKPTPPSADDKTVPENAANAPGEEDSKKKFSKKY